MRRQIATFAAVCVLLVAVGTVNSQEPSSGERLAAFDQGPETIDVSSYPEEMQANYQVFAAKCSQCHKLSRPINSDYALPDEWSRYVKRMMRKPGSGITPKDGKVIFDFLAYDSSIRKKELIEKKTETGGG